MKNDKLATIGTIFILFSSLVLMFIEYEIDIDKLNKKLQDKQNIIESQAELLIEKDKEIESCEWYKSYYYDSVCEEGCEVSE